MELRTYPIEALRRRASQPRKDFDETKLSELADSIREHGILEPLVVRDCGDGSAEIIAGERRWRAAQRAGLKEVPCVLRDLAEGDEGDCNAKVLALIENIQRADLSPIEKAEAIRSMIEEHQISRAEAGRRVGKSKGWITQQLSLLDLPDDVQQLVRDGKVPFTHALLLRAATGDVSELARRIAEEKLTTRDVERAVKWRNKRRRKSHRARPRTASERDLEQRLRAKFGVKAEVKWGARKGKIVLHIPNLDVLDSFIEAADV